MEAPSVINSTRPEFLVLAQCSFLQFMTAAAKPRKTSLAD
jgi:hypothetical protein